MRYVALTLGCVFLTATVGCDKRTSSGFPGYVEAEFVRVSSPLAGTLAQLDVKRGENVATNAPLFVLESGQERPQLAEANARLNEAQATLADVAKARRPPEIAAVRAQVAEADAALQLSEAELFRTKKLIVAKFIAPQKLDEVTTRRDADRARLVQARAQLAVANLPSRVDAIAAASAEVEAAKEAVAEVQWRLDQKSQRAPAAGLVDDTLYRPGEWVAAGAPVVSLLPPGNVKVRFYIPEPLLATVALGSSVQVRCDGCAQAITARVSFIAPQAEYTPPVIYSRENRAKLVFLAEARPETPQPGLHPGLPVEVMTTAPVRSQ